MEAKIITADEIRGYELGRLRELEGEIRNELANDRMDIYQAAGANSAKAKILKKNLARVLTVTNEKRRTAKNTHEVSQ